MPLSEILAAAKLTLEAIETFAPFAQDLAEAFGVAYDPKLGKARGVYMRFVTKWITGHPDQDRAQATQMYHLSKYFYNQAEVLGQLNPQSQIDRNLAAHLPRTQDEIKAKGQYRFHVFMSMRWPGEQNITTFDSWVYSKDLMSPELLHERAVQELVKDMEGISPEIIKAAYEIGTLGFSIKQFVYFTASGF